MWSIAEKYSNDCDCELDEIFFTQSRHGWWFCASRDKGLGMFGRLEGFIPSSGSIDDIIAEWVSARGSWDTR